MSTRSLIGKLNPDGTVTAIYCHYDGYPSCVGKILLEHYTDPAKVDSLLALGDISILGREIGQKQDFDSRNREEGWTLAYGRDRGERDIAAHTDSNADAFLGSADNWGAEFLYLFTAGHWTYASEGLARKHFRPGFQVSKFSPLTAETCANNA